MKNGKSRNRTVVPSADAAVDEALEMYRACEKEPRQCKLIGDGIETMTTVPFGGNATIAGIIGAIREGRISRVVSFC